MHGVDLDAGEAALLQQHRRGDHLVDLLLDLILGQGGSDAGRVVIVRDLRGTEAAQGVASVPHGHLGHHLGPVGIQAFQQLHRRALEALGGFQGLLAVQRMDGVHQRIRVKGPGENEAKAALGPLLKVGQAVL